VSNEIQQTRYDRMVRRVAGIIGPGSKVAEVITELFPMINLEEPPSELLLLGGTVLGMGASDLTGAAAQFPKIQLFNPVDSGQIVTVTEIYHTATASVVFRVSRDTAPLASGIATQVARDTRQIASSLPTAAMFQESSVGLINANMLFFSALNLQQRLRSRNDVMVLAPGTGITISNSTAASRMIVTFLWRERPAEPSELSI